MENKSVPNSPIINKENFKEEDTISIGAQCQFNGSWFYDGSTTCIKDTDHVCRDGRWVRLGTREHCR